MTLVYLSVYSTSTMAKRLLASIKKHGYHGMSNGKDYRTERIRDVMQSYNASLDACIDTEWKFPTYTRPRMTVFTG